MNARKKRQVNTTSITSKLGTAPTPLAPVVVAHRLVALPVRGDAFLLVRGDKPVLVDGGGNGAELYKELQTELPNGIHIGRIICTHNDADHANGLAQLLEDEINYPMSVDEVWLPGSWAEPIDALAKSDGLLSLFTLILSIEACKAQFSGERNSPLQQLFDAVLKGQAIETFHPSMPEKKYITAEESAEREQMARTLRETTLMTLKSDRNQQSKQLPCMDTQLIHKAIREGGILGAGTSLEKRVAGNLIQYLVEAGVRIHKIATAAVTRGAIIRWFDADQYYREWPRAASGGDPDLVPLNSKELLTFPDPELDIGDLLFLTTVNLHSLVFWAPEDEYMPGCIFSADGLLDGDILSKVPQRKTAVTAPHHGSPSNAPDAYVNLEKVIGKKKWQKHTILLRSDRYVSKNPCKEFKSTSQRLCTVCPKKSYPHKKQTLGVCPGNYSWDFGAANAVRGCTCA